MLLASTWGLVMRTLFGAGTPRGLQGPMGAFFATLTAFTNTVEALWSGFVTLIRPFSPSGHAQPGASGRRLKMASATGS